MGVSVYVGQPLDTVKVKMQTFPHLYPNLIECTKQTLLKDGVARGLYAGTVPLLPLILGRIRCFSPLMEVVRSSLLAPLELTRPRTSACSRTASLAFLLHFGLHWSSALQNLLNVGCSLLDNLTSTYKAMRESEALAGRPPPKTGPGKLTGQILRQDGVPGLFRGLTATFTREMPGYFFFFMAYEATRHVLTPAGKTKDEIGALRTVVARSGRGNPVDDNLPSRCGQEQVASLRSFHPNAHCDDRHLEKGGSC